MYSIRCLIVALTLFCPNTTRLVAETNIPPVISKLLSLKKAVSQIHSYDLSFLHVPVDSSYQKNERILWRTDDKLYLGIEGTGIVFKLLIIGDSLGYIRIDKTKYAGSHFCAANFVDQNKVYSFGGYGFWQTNGALRYFNPAIGEWDIQPLDKEYPNIFCASGSGSFWNNQNIGGNIPNQVKNARTSPAFYWVDALNHDLYTFTTHNVDEITNSDASTEKLFNKQILRLNLSQLKWEEIGLLNRYGWNKMISLPWGLLIEETSTMVYLADVRNNKILELKNEQKEKLTKLTSVTDWKTFYCIDSTIYFGNSTGDKMDSISLSIKDFVFSGQNLYSPQKIGLSKIHVASIVIVLLILFSFVFIIFIKKKKKWNYKNENLEYPKAFVENMIRQDLFSEVEKGLLQLLWHRSQEGAVCTTEDLNKTLGVYAKNESIKRKVRSETIGSINEKWIIASGMPDKLILSQKSIFDKRSREYILKEKFLENEMLCKLIGIVKENQ